MTLAFVLLAASAGAATWYVDSSVGSSGNGQSWATAWKNIENITGVSAGDTVYISGGPSGSSQHYPINSQAWVPRGGSTGNPITYKIGQDPNHNGTAIFTRGTGNPNWWWLGDGLANVVISGDAGDGKMHFAISGFAVGISANGTGIYNTRVCYVNLGSLSEVCFLYPCGPNFEFDHWFAMINDPAADHGCRASCYGSRYAGDRGFATTWDANKFHHFTLYTPSYNQSPQGAGADGLQLSGSFSVYDSFVYSFPTGLPGGNHPDGIESMGGAYIKIYNNVFSHYGNADINLTDEGGAYFHHTWIWNNIVINPNGANGGIIVGTHQAGGMVDVIIVNNTTDSNVDGIALNNVTAFPYTWTDCLVANNAVIAGQIDMIGNSTTPAVNNASLSSADASVNFISYVSRSTNSNFRLKANAMALIGRGTNLSAISSLFALDKDGNARPSAGPWDIGAYQFSSGPLTNPLISVYPPAIDFGTVWTGRIVTNSFTIENAGGGVLSGMASVAAPFEIVSGGTYSLGSSQSQVVRVSYTPSLNGDANESKIVTFTGGGGFQARVSGNRLVVLSGLSFPSSAGTITAPFTTSDGYISQSVQTGVADGGRAVYGFNITTAGEYVVSASVNAPSDGANSFYLNIDAEPTDPTSIWDIPVTSGFMNLTACWRGAGTPENSQYVPVVFQLNAGTHQLTIVGREAGAGLKQITIAPYSGSGSTPPSPPPNLRIVSAQ